jgi:hypothetical protein
MRSLAICLLALPTLLSCGSSGSSAAYSTQTAIEVSPEGFGLDGTCGSSEGELLTYVATLVDISDDEKEKAVMTSPPTPCDRAVRFTDVNAGSRGVTPHRYVADLLGFDRADVTTKTAGSKYEADGEPLEARWLGSCGRLDWPDAVTELEEAPNAVADAGAGDGGLADAGAEPLDPTDPLPLLPEAIPDSGFYRSYWGPQYAVSRRTVQLRGCYLLEVQP